MLLFHSFCLLVFAALLTAIALFSQADSQIDSSCHSDTTAATHDAAREAHAVNPAAVQHVAATITVGKSTGFDRCSLSELRGLRQ